MIDDNMKVIVELFLVFIGSFVSCKARTGFDENSGKRYQFEKYLRKVLLKSILWRSCKYISHTYIPLGCECNNFIGHQGYGKCETKYNGYRHRHLRGSLVCYVNIPNSCSDFTRPSPGLDGKLLPILSAAACDVPGIGKAFKYTSLSSKIFLLDSIFIGIRIFFYLHAVRHPMLLWLRQRRASYNQNNMWFQWQFHVQFFLRIWWNLQWSVEHFRCRDGSHKKRFMCKQ